MKNLNKILVDKNLTIKEAMRVIYIGAIRIAIIIDDSKKLYGVVTDGDIRRGILNGKDIQDKISGVTNINPIYLSIDATNQDILNILIKNPDIIGIPLVNKNRIVKDFVMLSNDQNLIYFSKTIPPNKHLNNILVIGGAGYIGSVLIRELLSRNYKVTILDNFIYGKHSLDNINNPNLKIINGDTRHIEIVTDAASNVDAVVHLAELVGDPICNLDPKTTQNINYLATKLISSICKHYQINRFVYTSSCSVYGASANKELLTEDSQLNPVSLYARMKIESENALLDMADNNFSPTILRLGTVFGYSPRPRFDLVVNLLTAKALKDGKITIFGGDQWRPNIHVSDVAKAIITVLESPIQKVAGEIFNVGSNELNLTINQISQKIKLHIPNFKIIINDNNDDKRNYKVDFTKIQSNLSFTTKKTIDDGIIELINAFDNGKIAGSYKDDIYSNVNFLRNKILETKDINIS